MCAVNLVRAIASIGGFISARTFMAGIFKWDIHFWMPIMLKLAGFQAFFVPLTEINDYLVFHYALIRFQAIQTTKAEGWHRPMVAFILIIIAVIVKYGTVSFDLAAATDPINLRTHLVFYFHFSVEYTLIIAAVSAHIYFVFRMNRSLFKSIAFLATIEKNSADEAARGQARRRMTDRRRLISFNRMALACHVTPPLIRFGGLLWQGYFTRGWCDSCFVDNERIMMMAMTVFPLYLAGSDLVDKAVSIVYMVIHFVYIPGIRSALVKRCCCRKTRNVPEEND